MSGGEGAVWGTVIGAIIYTLLANGFVLMNIASFWQLVVVGCLIILAVYVDEYQRKLRLETVASRGLADIAPESDAEAEALATG